MSWDFDVNPEWVIQNAVDIIEQFRPLIILLFGVYFAFRILGWIREFDTDVSDLFP